MSIYVFAEWIDSHGPVMVGKDLPVSDAMPIIEHWLDNDALTFCVLPMYGLDFDVGEPLGTKALEPIIKGLGDFVVVLRRGDNLRDVHYHNTTERGMHKRARALCDLHTCGSMQTDDNVVEVAASDHYNRNR